MWRWAVEIILGAAVVVVTACFYQEQRDRRRLAIENRDLADQVAAGYQAAVDDALDVAGPQPPAPAEEPIVSESELDEAIARCLREGRADR